MFTYKVLDDFVSENDQNLIRDFMLDCSWEESKNISGVQQSGCSLPNDLFLAKNQSGYYVNIYPGISDVEVFFPLLNSIGSLLPIAHDIIRIRGGKFNKNEQGGIHLPHVDYYYNHYTLLYYVNDSDGDTFLFNEMSEAVEPPSVPSQPKSFTLLSSISPKMGRAVLFNGLLYHSSSLPQTHQNRMAININIVPSWESISL